MGVAAGVFGVDSTVGMALLAAMGVYILVGLFAVQPRLHRQADDFDRRDHAGTFLARALQLTAIEDIAREFRSAVHKQLGTTDGFLIAPMPDGSVRALGAGFDESLDELGDAFLWLGERTEAITREELEALSEFPGAQAALKLANLVGGDVLLPLRHRGVLLGLGVIGHPNQLPGTAAGFYKAMRAATTAAMANTYLDAEAQGRSALARTFDLATAMQESLMPDDKAVRRPTFELRGMFSPVAECGGDLWSWRELGGGKLLLVIADATGHGAAPALLAAVAKGAIDAHWQLMGADLEPGSLLTALNRSIHRVGRTRYMMTAFAAVLDKSAQRLSYANAAQNFPFFINGTGDRKIEALIARGNTLGAASEAHYETHTRDMHMGDKLLLYTDGIVDAVSPSAGIFGERRLRAAVAALAQERATRIPELLMAEVTRYSAGAELTDDITLAAAEFGPTENR